MKKWIRWKGLLGFVVVVALLMAFFILFIDTMIKNAVEYTGTQAVGAKVDLARAEFRFSPLGLRLDGLQVTNPDQPMQNIVDIRQISFNMDGLNLLRRKVLINEMRVDGVRLNTPRQTSGEIHKKPEPATEADKEGEGFALPDMAIPVVKEVLSREELKTLKLADDYKVNVKTGQDNWYRIRDGIPGEKEVNAYKQQLAKLKETDTKDKTQLVAAVKELKEIKNRIKADIQYVDDSQKQIRNDLDRLSTDLKTLKDSPKAEYERLADKYTFSGDGLGNISNLLFGAEAKKYTRMAMEWYKKLQPWLSYVDFSAAKAPPKAERLKGVDIRFKEYQPAPAFLIKLARVTVELDKGAFKGEIKDISNEQHITRRPTTLHFSGDKMQGIGSVLLSGTFNHIDPAKAKDTLSFSMLNYQMDKHRLIDQKDMVVTLDKAKSDIKLVADRANNNIAANFTSHIHSIDYNNKASGNELSMMFLNSINKTRDFNIYGKLQGTFSDYSTQLSSDLDERLKANMKQHMNERLAGFKKELREKVEAKTRQPIHEAEGKFNDLNSSVKNDIAIRKASLEQELNKLEQDLKAKEDQLKAKADGKKQQLEDKAKQKLKGLFK